MRIPFVGFVGALGSLGFSALAIPAIGAAATLTDTLVFLSTFLNGVIGLFITLAIVVFFWGLIKYLFTMEQESAHESLKIMFWGVIAIFA